MSNRPIKEVWCFSHFLWNNMCDAVLKSERSKWKNKQNYFLSSVIFYGSSMMQSRISCQSVLTWLPFYACKVRLVCRNVTWQVHCFRFQLIAWAFSGSQRFWPWTIFKKYPMDPCAVQTPHGKLVSCTQVSECFIKDFWNSLWTTKNSRWITSGPAGLR